MLPVGDRPAPRTPSPAKAAPKTTPRPAPKASSGSWAAREKDSYTPGSQLSPAFKPATSSASKPAPKPAAASQAGSWAAREKDSYTSGSQLSPSFKPATRPAAKPALTASLSRSRPGAGPPTGQPLLDRGAERKGPASAPSNPGVEGTAKFLKGNADYLSGTVMMAQGANAAKTAGTFGAMKDATGVKGTWDAYGDARVVNKNLEAVHGLPFMKGMGAAGQLTANVAGFGETARKLEDSKENPAAAAGAISDTVSGWANAYADVKEWGTTAAELSSKARTTEAVGKAAARETAESLARVGAKAGGRFVPGVNGLIAAADTATFVSKLADPSAKPHEKVLAGVTAAGSILAATNIPVVSQAGAVVSGISGIIGGLWS